MAKNYLAYNDMLWGIVVNKFGFIPGLYYF